VRFGARIPLAYNGQWREHSHTELVAIRIVLPSSLSAKFVDGRRPSVKTRILAIVVVVLMISVCLHRSPGSAEADRIQSPLLSTPAPLAATDQEPLPREAPLRLPSPASVDPQRGFRPPELDLAHLKGDLMPDGMVAQFLPSQWDWRDMGKVTSVKNQGACGSCYAFGTVANIESKLLIDGAGTFDFSENHSKECIWEERNNYSTAEGPFGSCDGGNYLAVANLFSQTGLVLESCDPYVASDVSCKTSCTYEKTILDWRQISGDEVPDTDVLKSYVMNYGPLAVSMYAGFDGFDDYDGSYTFHYTGSDSTNHCVLVVGWDDSLVHAGGSGGWIVKNSYGTAWGDDGYFTIAYGSASFGHYARFVRQHQEYDSSGDLLYYDDAGWTASWGYDDTTAWGLARFVPDDDTWLTGVEFWTTDRTSDVDVYIYDSFDGARATSLLFSKLDLSYQEAGYHSLSIDPGLPLTDGNDVVAVVKLTNASYTFPVAADKRGPHETGRTYMSHFGVDGTWEDMGVENERDVGIRLRTSDVGTSPTRTPTPTTTGLPVPTLTPTPIVPLPGDLLVTGLVYDASIGFAAPVANAVVSLRVCSGQARQVLTGQDGSYSILLRQAEIDPCGQVLQQAWAQGYYGFSGTIAVVSLRANPVRHIGLTPIGPGGPTRTPGPTRTSTPTATLRVHNNFLPIVLRAYPELPSPTPTPTPTASPTPGEMQLIVNGGFETDEAWHIPMTDYPAVYTMERARTGSRSMRLGVSPGANVFSYSSVQQTVDIPGWAREAVLSYYYHPEMVGGDGDRLYFCVLRASDGQSLGCDHWVDVQQDWTPRTYDLLDHAGTGVIVRFGMKNDGLADTSTAYLDDVELWVRP
jgi:C1A family cysteine protease